MAESAVNISSIQHRKPNIFELVAQESLVNHIHPALKSLCVYASKKNVRLFGPVLKWYEEVFFGTNFVLQYFYLKGFNSSFSEAFYGLKRIKAFTTNTKDQLPSRVFTVSLFCLAVIPYMRQKISILMKRYEDEQFYQFEERRQAKVFALKAHKTIATVYEMLRLYYIVSYTAGFAKVHDPLLKISGVELIYQNRNMPGWKDIWRGLISSKTSTYKVTLKLFLKLVASSLEIGAFFIQFLSWWYSDESKVGNLTKKPIPKPPHQNTRTVLCPICLRLRKNEVVLITSGYVYCYRCIKDYLDKKGKCPVTNLPSKSDNLVRIYSSDL